MSEWISVKKHGKPKEDCLCWVTNNMRGTCCVLALFFANSSIFVLYDLKAWDHPALDVTHYVILPGFVSSKDE